MMMLTKFISLLLCISVTMVIGNNDTFDAANHNDWGSYYDPMGVFCGDFDCYKILGFDYEEFGRRRPDTKEITKRYRSLSRYWHPDKNKQKDAKDRFVKIARAYEVLTKHETRKEYDFLRYNQEAYFDKYGSSVLFKYAPKSDVLFVIFLILSLGSLLSWHLQKQQWQSVASRLIRAAVEDRPKYEGGTPESKELREKALAILKEREKQNGNDDPAAKKKKKGGKLTPTEKRLKLQEDLRPIVTELVDQIQDFGAGYHKPTWRDLFVVRLVQVPVYFVNAISWNAKYLLRRLQKIPLSDEEREVLTKRAVGEVKWVSATPEEQKHMKTLELWKAENIAKWEEEREWNKLSSTERKRIKRAEKMKGDIDLDGMPMDPMPSKYE